MIRRGAILAAYGKILPIELLSIPAHGFLNIHPSLLPQYRGSSPVVGALLSGDTETGVSLICLDAKMDHGPIIAQEKTQILPTEHRSELELRLAKLGGKLVTQSLLPYLDGTLQPIAQIHADATYTKLLNNTDARLDWTNSATVIDRRVRALDPWPGTKTIFQGQPLKILAGRPATENIAHSPAGTVINYKSQPAVVCGEGVYLLEKIQVASGKPTNAVDFCRGHRDFIGSHLD